MKVEFSPNAEADLDEIAQYIARDNLLTAERWVDKLVKAASDAADAPLAGRMGSRWHHGRKAEGSDRQGIAEQERNNPRCLPSSDPA